MRQLYPSISQLMLDRPPASLPRIVFERIAVFSAICFYDYCTGKCRALQANLIPLSLGREVRSGRQGGHSNRWMAYYLCLLLA